MTRPQNPPQKNTTTITKSKNFKAFSVHYHFTFFFVIIVTKNERKKKKGSSPFQLNE
jgi:hypothetical protein